ncbi:MAG: protein kinase [Kofleriaceae bacterium]
MVAWDVCPGEETIAAFAAGRLARAERDALESHIDTCSACQELVVALARLGPFGTREPDSTAGVPSIPTERDSWTPGGQLGRYVLLARLGAGGMGVVYSAYDPELDRRVAVKVLRRTRAGDQLREEARAIAKLSHPNVIAVHDVGEADGEVFVAMEHVDGQTVRDWMRTPRPTAEILDVFVQAGRGLAAAHAAGLVHRDVKPSNIIVGADGRARVLDFGLAQLDAPEGVIAGTPRYMAPEQKRGDKVDARADQYAFAASLSEALFGDRRGDASDSRRADVSERVTGALRRASSEHPEDRFASMDDLLAELVPPPPKVRYWVFVAALVSIALVGAVVIAMTRTPAVASCEHAGDAIDRVWGPTQHAQLRAAFGATKLPFAQGVATTTTEQLDAWTARWRTQADASCRATVVDKVQPVATHALRQSCLEGLAQRLTPIVALVLAPDAEVVARASSLTNTLPAPERCADIAALVALPPLPPAETARAEIASVREEIARHEAALLAGRAEQVRADVLALQKRAEATDYAPVKARAQLLLGRLEVSAAHYTEGIAALHLAAQAATAARDLETLADVWIELSKALGNDLRTLDEAELFDGYAQALIGQLPDREERELELAFARCNRNVTAAQAAEQAKHCARTIELGERATPPKRSMINAARARLGHFQRMRGDPERALATLQAALDEAIAIHGPQHPEVAIAHYVLGIALIDRESYDAGIAQLREALAIREVAFPGGNVQVAESLIGLGDALGASGKAAESVEAIERGLAILESLGQGESAHAANAHILVGMSLQELGRVDDALAHFVKGADIADRSLQHREAIVAMGLRLAASVEVNRERYAAAVPHLERAIRVLERGKASPIELGKTQFALAQILFELGPVERERAKAIAASARASYVAAGNAGAAGIAEVDALVRGK